MSIRNIHVHTTYYEEEYDSPTTVSEGSTESVRSEWSDSEEEEQLPPASDSHRWNFQLLGTVVLLFLVRLWHKDYLQYFVGSIMLPGPALSESARPLHTGLMWFSSAALFRLLRKRASEWERCEVQRQRRLEKLERLLMWQ
ncbi:uncharacterized protein LOC108151818 [Drosophila miranda]|uniref:uncharacterized protein LOC108151818 n=1 Tax=Drosophila miranda TaxID=7229 RepID=UPI0007E722CE|nr:uncharacterized protein LOC108151818 [Drosophila miranda]